MDWMASSFRRAWRSAEPSSIISATACRPITSSGMVASSTTNVSDAVGTPMPFEAIAAEFLDGNLLADELEARGSRA